MPDRITKALLKQCKNKSNNDAGTRLFTLLYLFRCRKEICLHLIAYQTETRAQESEDVTYIEILVLCKRECGTSSRYTGIIIMALIKRALIKSARRRESAINNGPICSRYPTTRGPATQFTPLAFAMTNALNTHKCYEKCLVFFFSRTCFSRVEVFLDRW